MSILISARRVAWESPTFDPVEYGSPEDIEEGNVEFLEEPSELVQQVEGTDDVLAAAVQFDTSDQDQEDVLTILDEPIGTPPPPRPHRDGALVPLSELASHQGERVVIVLESLERVSAYVVSVEGQTVRLRHRVGGGSVTYTVGFDDIKEVRSRRVP